MSTLSFYSDIVGDYGYKGALFTVGDSGGDHLVRLADGREFLIDSKYLRRQSDGTTALTLLPEELDRYAVRERHEAPAPPAGDETVLEAAEEQLDVGKRTLETGRVRVEKKVSTNEVTVDEPLLSEQFEVERVTVNRLVDAPQEIRREGDTIVIPLVEEVLVVEKRLVLREEVRVTRKREETHKPQRIAVQREEIAVDRTGAQRS